MSRNVYCTVVIPCIVKPRNKRAILFCCRENWLDPIPLRSSLFSQNSDMSTYLQKELTCEPPTFALFSTPSLLLRTYLQKPARVKRTKQIPMTATTTFTSSEWSLKTFVKEKWTCVEKAYKKINIPCTWQPYTEEALQGSDWKTPLYACFNRRPAIQGRFGTIIPPTPSTSFQSV